VSSLTPDRRQALAEVLRRTLSGGRDGRIDLNARAWAARAVVD
jgi:hypothetical protein